MTIDEQMALSAIRYALGRRTYIVHDTVVWILHNWPKWGDEVKRLIKRDIEEEFTRDDKQRAEKTNYRPLGDDCDREDWERVRALWQDVLECKHVERDAFIAGYTHGVTMARFEFVPSPEDAYKMAVASELGLA